MHYSDCDEGAFRIMAVPGEVTAHCIVIEAQIFGRFQVLFDAKACANRLHHERQRRLHGSVDQVIGQLVRVVEAATDHEPMTTVRDTSMYHRQASPVEEA